LQLRTPRESACCCAGCESWLRLQSFCDARSLPPISICSRVALGRMTMDMARASPSVAHGLGGSEKRCPEDHEKVWTPPKVTRKLSYAFLTFCSFASYRRGLGDCGADVVGWIQVALHRVRRDDYGPIQEYESSSGVCGKPCRACGRTARYELARGLHLLETCCACEGRDSDHHEITAHIFLELRTCFSKKEDGRYGAEEEFGSALRDTLTHFARSAGDLVRL
jgi:hypothetical protein